MLILQRRAGESIRIGDDVEVTIVSSEGGRVRLAISAPKDVQILRSELIDARETNQDAAMEQVNTNQLLTMLDGLLPSAPKAQKSPAVKLLAKKDIPNP